jgi:hypothetical protein
MSWLIAGATLVAWVLVILGVIPVWAAIVATVAIVFIGAWRLDRTGRYRLTSMRTGPTSSRP